MTISAELKEKVKKAAPFTLPKEITMQKTMTLDGLMSYVFRHETIGELGRLIIVPHSGQQTQFNVEVAGSPNDPMTKKRQAILEPLTRELLGRVDSIIGKPKPTAEPAPYESPKTKHVIKSQIMPCKSCNKPVAMLIFAPEATTASELEDYARLMYEPMQQTNVPTWILGDEHDVKINDQQDIQIFLMKAYPHREEAQHVLASVFDPALDVLIDNHCKPKGKKAC